MDPVGLFGFGVALGLGLVVIGAAYGIGSLAQSALESTGRQPEAADSIQTQMVIAAALIEGFTFAAIGVAAYGLFVVSGFSGDTSSASESSSHAELNKPAAERTVSELG
jgi:F-type H+-transporting ATPase subunit c